jgi:AGZA family xanthine/uracil permease-like MFS transporter
VIIAIFGIVLTIALRALGVRGDLLIGIVLTTAFATVVNYAADVYPKSSGWARWPDDVFQAPDFSIVGNVSFDAFDAAKLGVIGTLEWVFSLFLADFFDTMGTLVGVGRQAGYVNARGSSRTWGSRSSSTRWRRPRAASRPRRRRRRTSSRPQGWASGAAPGG